VTAPTLSRTGRGSASTSFPSGAVIPSSCASSRPIPTVTELNLPEIVLQAAKEKTGLVLVTGATGSGKSTSLAAMIEHINLNACLHVITLEDPVEFIYQQKKATIISGNWALIFDEFANGLRAALRQAPKVILVGEMRDRDTVEIVLNAGGNRTLGL